MWNFLVTFCCPGPEGAVVINGVVESQGDDEEGAVAGRVHLERHVALVQPHRLALLCQGRLKQLPRHLGAKMESVNVAKRLQKASCNQKAPGLIPSMANIFIRGDVSMSVALTDNARSLNVSFTTFHTSQIITDSTDVNGFYWQDVIHNTHTFSSIHSTVTIKHCSLDLKLGLYTWHDSSTFKDLMVLIKSFLLFFFNACSSG